jgi:diguanylate cyclase (GGDEF)-like protein
MAHSSFGVVGKEKRRFTRQPTLQTAHIRFGEGMAISSEIRDYCQNGLYVAFLGDGTLDDALPSLVGAPVQVEFSVADSAAYGCSGRVARVSPGGVGIFVATMPEGALHALRRASIHLVQPISAQANSRLSPQQTQALQLECTSQFRSFLNAVMQDFFQGAVERLGQAGQDESSFLERSRYDYGAQELLQRRSRIEDDFFNAIRERIQDAEPVAEASCGAPSASKLALVEEAEFEDWLNLSAVIRQVEADIALQLDTFEQRYSQLAGMPVGRKNNPFGPEMIGRTFQIAIQGLDFSNPMRTVLYKTLGQAILGHATALYQQLNQTLVSLQPLEAPKAVRKQSPEPSAPSLAAAGEQVDASRLSKKPDLAEIADTLNALYKQDQTGIAQTPESAEYSLDRILAGLNQTQRRSARAADSLPPLVPRQADASLRQTFAARPEVLQVVSRLQQTAKQLVGRDGQTPQRAGMLDGAGAALPETRLTDLLLALDGLPMASPAAAGVLSLADQVDARIASAGGDISRLALNHRQILDTTADLFARARADVVPSSDIESLVKRLERPLLKLALQDTNFPNLPDHPARQVLNLIEQYAVAADDKGRFFDTKLQRFLYLLVDRVCSQADNDPGIFEMVRDSLEKVLLPILQIRRTRVSHLQEACEGKECIRSARSQVNAALEQRLAGREVPGMLLRLLDAGWRQYLVLLEMRQGAQGDAWNAALAVLDRLSEWFDPASEAPRSPELAQTLRVEVERALATVNVDASLLDAFMDELDASLVDDAACRIQGLAMVRVPPGGLASPGGRDGTLAQHPLADRLRVGDWWDFNVDGSRIPMQLIWISQPPANCTFANRSATNKTDLTLNELFRRMQRGQAQPGKDLDLPLIERSEQSLFDDTYQSVVRQAMHDPVTGLLNRKGFLQHLSRLTMPDQADKSHAVGIIEFDQFRMIVNTCGEEAAEKLTRSLASEVESHIGSDAVLAAFRDDTFALMLPNCSRVKGCSAVDRLLERVKDYSFQHEQHSYSIGFNVGITEFAPDRISAVEAIRRADSACITAKSQGRNRLQIYDQASPQLQSQESLMDWAGRIDSFLKGSGLHLRCQQVMPIGRSNVRLPYYEVLLGIEGEDGVEILPGHFIPAVERLQRAHEVDIWVMRNVFEWIAANRSDFASVGGFAINLSATSLSNPEVMRYLQEMLPVSDFPTDKIIFEITESAAIESYGAAQDFIREIRRYGCKFSLDDFGSGFTSYSHLKNLRTDTLKIDGSFVKDMLLNAGDFAMVKSMNDIGHSLGLLTVAEYVESETTLEALREIGVDYVQGFAIHKPCRIDDILSAQAA